ncbi:hypothetical protein FOZ63_004491, partial [Perkinsus olseni]
ADAAQMAGLSDSGLWKYLNLTALQESDSRGLSSHIRQQHLESAPYKEKLLAAEAWLLGTFASTNTDDTLYQRLDDIPHSSTMEHITHEVKAIQYDAACMNHTLHESTLKRAIVNALPSSTQAALRTVHPNLLHISLSQLVDWATSYEKAEAKKSTTQATPTTPTTPTTAPQQLKRPPY